MQAFMETLMSEAMMVYIFMVLEEETSTQEVYAMSSRMSSTRMQDPSIIIQFPQLEAQEETTHIQSTSRQEPVSLLLHIFLNHQTLSLPQGQTLWLLTSSIPMINHSSILSQHTTLLESWETDPIRQLFL